MAVVRCSLYRRVLINYFLNHLFFSTIQIVLSEREGERESNIESCSNIAIPVGSYLRNSYCSKLSMGEMVEIGKRARVFFLFARISASSLFSVFQPSFVIAVFFCCIYYCYLFLLFFLLHSLLWLHIFFPFALTAHTLFSRVALIYKQIRIIAHRNALTIAFASMKMCSREMRWKQQKTATHTST